MGRLHGTTAAGLLLVTGVLAAAGPPRTDIYGDPLPPGVRTRMGTVRLRHLYAQFAFAADGKTLLSAGNDQSVRVWDVKTGKQLRRIPLRVPGQKAVNGSWLYALAADGRTLAGWSRGEGLRLWDARTGNELRHIPLDKGQVMRLALAADGKVVAAGTYDGGGYKLLLWDTATGKKHARLDNRQHFPEAFVLSPDGKLLATGDYGDSRLWDVAAGKVLHRLGGKVGSLLFSPDGKTLASGHSDGSVKLWGSAQGKERATLRPSVKGPVMSLAFSPDGHTLAAATQKDLTLWDLRTRKELRRLPAWGSLAFSPDGKTLASAGHSSFRLWDVTTGKPLQPDRGPQGEIACVAVAPGGKVLASLSWAGTEVYLWDSATGKPLAVLRGHTSYVRICAFSADGKRLVSGAGDGTVRLCDVQAGKELRTFSLPALKGDRSLPHVMDVRLSPDGNRLAALGMSGDAVPATQVSVWDAASGKLLVNRPFRGDFRRSWLAPDGRTVALVTHEGLTLEDTATGKELFTSPGYFFQPMTFSPDGKLLAAAVYGPEAQRPAPVISGRRVPRMEAVGVWELATGKQVVRVPTGPAGHLAFSPDGRLLATADVEALRLWDLATGKEVFSRPRHEALRGSHGASFVSSLVFLPGGDALATGLIDGTVLVWDVRPARGGKGIGAEERERLWADLAGNDAGKAHRALDALAAAPDKTVPLLKDRLRPAETPDPHRVERLLADLESDAFATRAAANRELAELGERVVPALRRVLERKPPLEVRKRVDALLGSALLADRGVARSGAALRTLRAIRLLERVATPEARRVLETLAAGAPTARTTREAKEALQRLAGR